jgi:hypothetical protein
MLVLPSPITSHYYSCCKDDLSISWRWVTASRRTSCPPPPPVPEKEPLVPIG